MARKKGALVGYTVEKSVLTRILSEIRLANEVTRMAGYLYSRKVVSSDQCDADYFDGKT